MFTLCSCFQMTTKLAILFGKIDFKLKFNTTLVYRLVSILGEIFSFSNNYYVAK